MHLPPPVELRVGCRSRGEKAASAQLSFGGFGGFATQMSIKWPLCPPSRPLLFSMVIDPQSFLGLGGIRVADSSIEDSSTRAS